MKTRREKLESNIWKLQAWNFLKWFLLWMPIFVPFVQSRGLSIEEIFLLQAIYSLIIVGLDVPTGYLADRYTRRLAIIIGSVSGAIGFVWMALGTSFNAFLFAEILLGLGAALTSGSQQAMLYETCVELKKEKQYMKENSKYQSLGRFSEAGGAIVGGMLAVISLALPFWVQVGVCAFSVAVAITLIEPKREDAQKREPFAHLLDIFLETLHRNKVLKGVVAFTVAIGVGTRVGAWITQPLFAQAGIPLSWYGWLWAALLGTAGIVSYFAHHLHLRVSRVAGLAIVLFFSAAGFLLIGVTPIIFSIVFLFLLQISRGLQAPFAEEYINVLVTSDRRATVFSIKSMIHNIVFAVVITSVGALTAQSPKMAFLAVGIAVTLAGAIALAYIAANVRHQKA